MVDVFGDGDENFVGYVVVFFGVRGLIFDVNIGSIFFNEEFGEFYDGGKIIVIGIGIGDDGMEVVDVGEFGVLCFGNGEMFLMLFVVVEKLGYEEMVDFVGDGSLV